MRSQIDDDEGRPFLHLNIGHVLCIVSVVGSAALLYAGITNGLAVHTVQISAIEAAVGQMRGDLTRMQQDVSFMRGQLRVAPPRGELERDDDHGAIVPLPGMGDITREG